MILATGSRPNAFPGMEIDGEVVQHSWQTVVNRKRPEKIVIVGGGIISCEMATIFRAYGSQVTILEALRTPPAGDGGAHLHPPGAGLQAPGDRVPDRGEGGERQAGGDTARVVYGKDGEQQQTIEADRCLIAVGIKPNSDNLGLEELGVQLERGYIKVDQRMQTNVPGVYAIGDVVAHPYALAHVASAEGVQAANAIAGRGAPLNYDNMPRPSSATPRWRRSASPSARPRSGYR